MRSNPRTLKSVNTFQQSVEHGLRRQQVLTKLRTGKVSQEEVCDADPYLLSAAKFHGKQSSQTCPVCTRNSLMKVAWVFGESLGHISGSARTEREIVELNQTKQHFTVHVVEVCLSCKWNHIIRSFIQGTFAVPSQSRKSPVSKTGEKVK